MLFMKSLAKLLMPLFMVSLLNACSVLPNQSTTTDSNSNTDPTSTSDGYIAKEYTIANPSFDSRVIPDKESVTFDDLFNLHNKVEIVIDVDREEMQKINDDNVYTGQFDSIKPETYHLAKKFTISLTNGDNTFTWEFENVGIRQKGNTSRKPIFTSNGKLYNKNHFKISFDETFDDTAKYDSAFIEAHGNQDYKNRDFLGMSGLDIKWNKAADSTHLREIYANMLFRSAGIIAQHVGLSTMKMTYDDNKTADFGLCYIYEQSNKELIKRSLQSDTEYINASDWNAEKAGTHGISGSKYGDLYKASYGKGDGASSGADFTSDSIQGKRLGLKTDIAGRNWPTYERKNDKKKAYDETQMKELVRVLNNAATTYEQIEALVDLEQLAMEEAIMYFLGNPDSMKYNYNNYMVYFRRVDGKMIIIPIDNDRAFGVANGWRNGLERILDANCKPLSNKPLSGNQRNPLLTKTLFATKDNQSKVNYKAALEAVRNSTWLQDETFERYYNILKETYNGLSTFSLDGGSGNMSFSSYVQVKNNIYDGKNPGTYVINPEVEERVYEVPTFPEDVPLYAIGSINSWGEDVTNENKNNFLFSFNGDKSKLSATFEVMADKYAPAPNRVQLFIQDGFTNDQVTYCYGVGFDDTNHIYQRISDGDNAYYPSTIEINAVLGDTISISIDTDSGEVTFVVNPN